MTKGYDSLNDTFNTDGSVEVDAIVKADEVTKVDEVKKDYDYTRGNLYSLNRERSRSNKRYYGSCRRNCKSKSI